MGEVSDYEISFSPLYSAFNIPPQNSFWGLIWFSLIAQNCRFLYFMVRFLYHSFSFHCSSLKLIKQCSNSLGFPIYSVFLLQLFLHDATKMIILVHMFDKPHSCSKAIDASPFSFEYNICLPWHSVSLNQNYVSIFYIPSPATSQGPVTPDPQAFLQNRIIFSHY